MNDVLPTPATGKSCSKCGKWKALERYRASKRGKDGLRAQCRDCDNAVTRAWQRKNRRQSLARARQWKKDNPAKARAYSRWWYEKNREAVAEKKRIQAREWHANNRERGRQSSREWHARNRERTREVNRRWRQENPERFAAIRAARLRKMAVLDGLSREYAASLRRDPCSYCGTRREIQIDHIEPISLGGANHWTNLTAACKSCNCSKQASSLLDFLARADRP